MTTRELIPNENLPCLVPGLLMYNPHERITSCPNCIERLERDLRAKSPFNDAGANI